MKSFFSLLLFFVAITGSTQSVGINTDGSQPNASAMLDVKSTVKGLLTPRMSSQQRINIPSPVKGLVVFDNDTNSFWFYNGAGWVQIAGGGGAGYWNLNGSNIYSTNAGNVGIGTSTPARPLTVKTASNSYGFSQTDGTRTLSSFIGDETNGNAAFFGTETNHPLYFFTNSSAPWMTLTQGGKLGIGTRTPADLLTVQASGWGITQTDGAITVGTWVGSDLGVNGGWLGTKSNHQLNFFTANKGAQMTLATNGNFGVGTPSPSEKLTVQTTNNSYGISHRGEGGNIIATFIGGTSAGIGTFSNTNMRIFCNNASAIFIGSGTNNVGIGKDFPSYKLEVNGTIRSKEIIVEAAPWPDYVFDENYQLPSLEDLSTFISKNRHLPNMLPASAIQNDGLALGDTQKKMMEKIEELTLYIIELKKELTILKIDMAGLKH